LGTIGAAHELDRKNLATLLLVGIINVPSQCVRSKLARGSLLSTVQKFHLSCALIADRTAYDVSLRISHRPSSWRTMVSRSIYYYLQFQSESFFDACHLLWRRDTSYSKSVRRSE